MDRITFSIISVLCLASTAYGTRCSWGSSSNKIVDLVNEQIETCPKFYESSDKTSCCINLKDTSFYCCDAEEFALKNGLGIIIPVIIAVVVIISLFVLCISCLCCACCPWYRRRHRGTVYGNLQTPTAVHVIQSSPPYPGYIGQDVQTQPPVYATIVSGMPQQPPPQYTQEAYAKQAPYNPGYVQ